MGGADQRSHPVVPYLSLLASFPSKDFSSTFFLISFFPSPTARKHNAFEVDQDHAEVSPVANMDSKTSPTAQPALVFIREAVIDNPKLSTSTSSPLIKLASSPAHSVVPNLKNTIAPTSSLPIKVVSSAKPSVVENPKDGETGSFTLQTSAVNLVSTTKGGGQGSTTHPGEPLTGRVSPTPVPNPS